ncbi:MAG: sigma-70 family RNA polymerase sigma factor [Bacilli bacterium]
MHRDNLDHEHIHRLAILAKTGDQLANQVLCERFTPLVYATVSRYREHAQERGDLLQVGYESLLRAIREFDPAQGVYFAHFAKLRVRAGVYTAVRRSEARQNREFADLRHNGARIDRLLANAVDAQACHPYLATEWSDLFSLLSARERIAVEWTVLRDFSTKEVADIYGVSKETVKTWRRRALKKLRSAVSE